VVTRRQRDSFAAGLWNVWSKKYPELFDPDDEALAKTQSKNGHHFYEWLAAILIFHGTGYLSLVEKYQFPKHQRKLRVVEKLASDGLNRAIELSNTKRITSQLPDLLVYAPDFSDWYFCEVKGGKDELGKRQLKDFELLASETGKSIRLINFELSNA
jgi:hypothetical protein